MNTMSGGMRIEQRDIVLALMPFSDLSDLKRRPCLVLSNSEFNKRPVGDIILCAITSNPQPTKYGISISNEDMERGFLKKPSKILPDALFTGEKNIITERKGKLSKEKFEKVIFILREIIEMDN